jgi:ABC-2 type transport system ATP-binding protein
MSAIEVRELRKHYGRVQAVNGVSFSVGEGRIFGLLGPNGAGKTTAIECVTGLKRQDAGAISVLGMDPLRDRLKLFERVGVQLQEASYPDHIKVWELCGMYASMYKNAADTGKLLEKLGIADKRNAFFRNLSGGQKQKLSILLALLPNPELVFLDELTTGLDPNARRTMWGHIRELKDEGRTVFMTTHYMEEAELLCDEVCIIDKGLIIASGTVADVIASCGLDIVLSFQSGDDGLAGQLLAVEHVKGVERDGGKYIVRCAGERAPGKVVHLMESKGMEYTRLEIARPTLDDAYIKLTGRSLREEEK